MGNSRKFKEVKKYYEERYKDQSRAIRTLEDYKIYLDYIEINKSSAGMLLDIACGTGMLLKNAEMKGLKTFGIDISMTALKLAKNNTLNTKFVISSGENMSFKDNIFDYVYCLGSLEHFLDIPKAISETIRVSKQKAKFYLMVPNTIHYRLDAKSKWGIKKITGTKQQEMHEELHIFEEWKNIFEKNGLRVERVYKDRFFVKKKNPLKNVLFYLWLKFLPLNYSYQFIFICKK